MPKASLNLPPLSGVVDKNVQSALQTISNWSRALNADYVSRDELKLPGASTTGTTVNQTFVSGSSSSSSGSVGSSAQQLGSYINPFKRVSTVVIEQRYPQGDNGLWWTDGVIDPLTKKSAMFSIPDEIRFLIDKTTGMTRTEVLNNGVSFAPDKKYKLTLADAFSMTAATTAITFPEYTSTVTTAKGVTTGLPVKISTLDNVLVALDTINAAVRDIGWVAAAGNVPQHTTIYSGLDVGGDVTFTSYTSPTPQGVTNWIPVAVTGMHDLIDKTSAVFNATAGINRTQTAPSWITATSATYIHEILHVTGSAGFNKEIYLRPRNGTSFLASACLNDILYNLSGLGGFTPLVGSTVQKTRFAGDMDISGKLTVGSFDFSLSSADKLTFPSYSTHQIVVNNTPVGGTAPTVSISNLKEFLEAVNTMYQGTFNISTPPSSTPATPSTKIAGDVNITGVLGNSTNKAKLYIDRANFKFDEYAATVGVSINNFDDVLVSLNTISTGARYISTTVDTPVTNTATTRVLSNLKVFGNLEVVGSYTPLSIHISDYTKFTFPTFTAGTFVLGTPGANGSLNGILARLSQAQALSYSGTTTTIAGTTALNLGDGTGCGFTSRTVATATGTQVVSTFQNALDAIQTTFTAAKYLTTDANFSTAAALASAETIVRGSLNVRGALSAGSFSPSSIHLASGAGALTFQTAGPTYFNITHLGTGSGGLIQSLYTVWDSVKALTTSTDPRDQGILIPSVKTYVRGDLDIKGALTVNGQALSSGGSWNGGSVTLPTTFTSSAGVVLFESGLNVGGYGINALITGLTAFPKGGLLFTSNTGLTKFPNGTNATVANLLDYAVSIDINLRNNYSPNAHTHTGVYANASHSHTLNSIDKDALRYTGLASATGKTHAGYIQVQTADGTALVWVPIYTGTA